MAFDIAGKAALVTGGGSGISLAFIKKLIERSCNVVIADLALRPEAEDLVNDSKDTKPRVVFVKTDVTDWQQIQHAFDEAVSEFGRLDIVCPGAGIFEPPPYRFLDVDQQKSISSYKVLDLNLAHPIRCTQLAIDVFMRQKLKRGVVVHISSVAAQMESPLVPLYTVSKAGLSNFIYQMKFFEESMGIRICGVAPANVQTPLWKDAKREEFLDQSKGDIWITTDRIADVMLTLTTQAEPAGGTVTEIGAEKTRLVERLGDPGPDFSAPGHTMSNINLAYAELEDGLKNFGK